MAIICRDHRLLVLQTPHTGSSSLGRALRQQLGCAPLLPDYLRDDAGRVILRRKHQTLPQLIAAGVITPDERAQLFVVAGVRNPFDIVFTQYARGFTVDDGDDGDDVSARADLSPEGFERFVKRRYATGLLLRLAGRKATVPADYAEGVDFLIRFESMQRDLDAALQRAGVSQRVELPHVNATPARQGRSYRDLTTSRTRAMIERAWAVELASWGYSFDGQEG
ncbi:MAG: hypothetical protein H0V36_11175 [Chloroflexi bacterium]|nr:hypothetical protein [Chloroflexota bacterium]